MGSSNFSAENVMKAVKFGDLDAIFDEKGSQFLALRKIQWVKEGNEPDESKAKLEIRKYRVTDEGEVPLKGVAFLTEDGPHELTHTLIREGFGKTKDIIKTISDRDDFEETLKHINDEEEVLTDGELFDMRSVMGDISSDDFEDEDE